VSERDDRGETQAVIRTASGFKLRSRKIRIEIIEGPDHGRTVELLGPQVSVGSGRGCDLVLADKTVSKRHMSLRVDGDGIRVIDAGSRNGTDLDGIQVRDAFARPDSRIAIGTTTLRLRLLSDMIELPLSNRDRFGGMLGGSAAMRQVFAVLERIAVTDATVLIEGESGTGKELVAEAVHDESERASRPFIVFDCSAVSASLIESELFGHIKGAFTGAQNDRVGAFEAADGGTLFLDEIGELPLDLQPKLLRALERLEVRPVGCNEPRRVDVRIVAATNRSLASEVDHGRFREDLYYRLAVIHLTLPPLRERADDIPMLVQHFCKQLARRFPDDQRAASHRWRRICAGDRPLRPAQTGSRSPHGRLRAAVSRSCIGAHRWQRNEGRRARRREPQVHPASDEAVRASRRVTRWWLRLLSMAHMSSGRLCERTSPQPPVPTGLESASLVRSPAEPSLIDECELRTNIRQRPFAMSSTPSLLRRLRAGRQSSLAGESDTRFAVGMPWWNC
jgi:hypothetical protein